jgi:hypothetical protein
VQLARDLGEGVHLDNRGPELGQLALGQVRMTLVERVRHDQPEHRVAEELKPLVGGQAAVLVRVRPMGERTLEGLGRDRGSKRAQQDLGVLGLGSVPVVPSSAHLRSQGLHQAQDGLST